MFYNNALYKERVDPCWKDTQMFLLLKIQKIWCGRNLRRHWWVTEMQKDSQKDEESWLFAGAMSLLV